MIRILQVFGRLTRGGLETFVMNLYREIDRTKIQFDFLVTGRGGDYEEEVERMGARIFRIPPRNLGRRKYNDALDEFFKAHSSEFAAIHEHASSLSSIEPLHYAKKYGIPVRIIHSHSSSISSAIKASKIHHLLHLYGKMRIPGLATHYFGCSDKALDWMFAGTSVRKKSEMINNGIPLKKFSFDKCIRDEVRAELGISDKYVIGHVASFIPVKNHKFLIDVFSRLSSLMPDAELVLAGDGLLRPEIERQISEYGLNNKVILTGVRSDVNRLLQGFDLFMMPSIFEGLPVSLVEAQTAGLPLLISDTISQDVKLRDEVVFKSLSAPLDNWVEEIIRIRNSYVRVDGSEGVDKHGFGIEGIAARFTQIYTGE